MNRSHAASHARTARSARRYRRSAAAVATACVALIAAGLSACGSSSSGGRASFAGTRGTLDPSPAAGSRPASEPAIVSGGGGKTMAIVGDTAVTSADLLPLLAEAAGGAVLDEMALAVVVQQECRRRGVRVTAEMADDEQRLLARQLAISAGLPESEGRTLVETVRQSRALGERRFGLLLATNAGLRAIVRADPQLGVNVTPEDIDTAYQLKHGPRVRARLILVRSRDQAAQAAQQLAAGQAFENVAAALSVDPSASQGGLLEPISLADSSYPVGVRRALQILSPGQQSEPIAVEWGGVGGAEAGFAIVKSEGTVERPGAPSRDAIAGELEAEVRIVRERARMERLGRELVRSAGISVVDPALAWSWDRYRGSANP